MRIAMRPIQNVLGSRVHARAELAHRVAAVEASVIDRERVALGSSTRRWGGDELVRSNAAQVLSQ